MATVQQEVFGWDGGTWRRRRRLRTLRPSPGSTIYRATTRCRRHSQLKGPSECDENGSEGEPPVQHAEESSHSMDGQVLATEGAALGGRIRLKVSPSGPCESNFHSRNNPCRLLGIKVVCSSPAGKTPPPRHVVRSLWTRKNRILYNIPFVIPVISVLFFRLVVAAALR